MDYSSILAKAEEILEKEKKKKKNPKLTFADITPELRERLSLRDISMLERSGMKIRGVITPAERRAMAYIKSVSLGGKIMPVKKKKLVKPSARKIMKTGAVSVPLKSVALLLTDAKTKEKALRIEKPITGRFFTRIGKIKKRRRR